jgi:hypothetical protein
VVAAEGVAPGQPVQQDRRLVAQEGPHLAHLLLVRHEQPVRVDDALRGAGRAGGEKDLGDGVRCDGGGPGVHLGARLDLQLVERSGTLDEAVRHEQRATVPDARSAGPYEAS